MTTPATTTSYPARRPPWALVPFSLAIVTALYGASLTLDLAAYQRAADPDAVVHLEDGRRLHMSGLIGAIRTKRVIAIATASALGLLALVIVMLGRRSRPQGLLVDHDFHAVQITVLELPDDREPPPLER